MEPTKNDVFRHVAFCWVSLHPKGIKMLGQAKLALRKFSAYAPDLRRISAAPL